MEGINILRSKIDRFLENKNIEVFGKEGEVLDPDIHDAMLTQKDDKKENNLFDLEVHSFVLKKLFSENHAFFEHLEASKFHMLR